MGHRSSVLGSVDRLAAIPAVAAIKVYQLAFSRFVRRTCLFRPSCSRHAAYLFRRFGFRLGWALTRRRLARCHGDYSMRIDALGQVELITRCGKLVRQSKVNPAIASRVAMFCPSQ